MSLAEPNPATRLNRSRRAGIGDRAEITFTEELHQDFAAFSGDCNPMHMDAVAARRTQAGLRVVHGIHSLLWALECLAASGQISAAPLRIRARFLRWAYVGDSAVLSISFNEKGRPKLHEITVMDMPIVSVELLHGLQGDAREGGQEEGADGEFPASTIVARREVPLDLSISDLHGYCGQAFTAEDEEAGRRFPCLCGVLGARTVAEIAACSCIVGMEVPGQHSIFSRLDLSVAGESRPTISHAALPYKVTDVDERFRKVRLSVQGASIAGTLEAFIRTPPVAQTAMTGLAGSVAPKEFARMRALVVGGSRGLGELTAKLIASGGGHAAITYALGAEDAERVVQEVRSVGGSAQQSRYDVRVAPDGQRSAIDLECTHLFYFATCPIFRPKGELVSPPILEEFVLFYLQGFHDLCAYLCAHRSQRGEPAGPAKPKLIAYYPSSTAVEERPPGMTEYAMVKAAGEEMCRDMNRYMPGIHVYTTRLPRLQTDQTAGFLPDRTLNAIQVMLPIVREARRLSDVA